MCLLCEELKLESSNRSFSYSLFVCLLHNVVDIKLNEEVIEKKLIYEEVSIAREEIELTCLCPAPVAD